MSNPYPLLANPRDDMGNRLPVWSACSELYLDRELLADDIQFIAKTCADSPYSSRDLDKIMFGEVWPALRLNLFSPAGEWVGWIDETLSDCILECYRPRPYLCWQLNPIKLFYCWRWRHIKTLIEQCRSAP